MLGVRSSVTDNGLAQSGGNESGHGRLETFAALLG